MTLEEIIKDYFGDRRARDISMEAFEELGKQRSEALKELRQLRRAAHYLAVIDADVPRKGPVKGERK
jgi:hypothetical protein